MCLIHSFRTSAVITTVDLRRAFAKGVQEDSLRDALKSEKGMSLPAYCDSWRQVAWKLSATLLHSGKGRKLDNPENKMFSWPIWKENLLDIPVKIIKNQGFIENEGEQFQETLANL